MNFRELSRIANDELYEQYPDADWDYSLLSMNLNISEEIMSKYAYKPWDYIKISMREDVNSRLDKYNAKIQNELEQSKNRKNKKNQDIIIFK